MSAQQQIVEFLEYMKIPMLGHVHDHCNLGNCAILYIDFSTPEGLKELGDALELYMFNHKKKRRKKSG